MSLIKYGIAAAAGYYFGQPRGRRQLAQVGQRIQQLGRSPKVKQLQERGWDKAYDSAVAAKRLVSSKVGGQKTVDPVTAAATTAADAADAVGPTSPAPSGGSPDQALQQAARRPTPRPAASPTTTDPAPTDPAPTGFGGRTVAEDSEAAFSGLLPPPPVGRTTPSSSKDKL